MKKKKIIIIGGGIAGLSAGIYAALNGFDTEILEMHTVAGGQCTAWTRKGYRFDYCLHWLVGTSKGPFNDIWHETNVLNDTTEVIDHDIHSLVTDSKGNEFIIYADINKWEQYLLGLAPEDAGAIRKMCSAMRKSALLEPFPLPPALRSPFDYIRILPKMLPVFNVIRKYGRSTCKEYFDTLKLKNPTLRNMLYGLYGDRNFSALVFIFMLGWFHQKNAGYIKGGSYPLAQRMVEKLKTYGGKISYNCKVAEIITENNVAAGVVLEDGRVLKADYVIGTADGYTTLYKMLKGRYTTKKFDNAYRNWTLFTPIVQVSYGIGKRIESKEPVRIVLDSQTPIGRTLPEYGYSIMNYAYDSTMSPEGKTTLVVRFESPWSLWKDLGGQAYQDEKAQILADTTRLLNKFYPGISECIEASDVATPLTDVRYTGVKDGAYEGFLPSKENMMKGLDMQLPGLGNFYMAGQWLFPGGGLPPSAQTGKWAVQLICKKEKMPFINSKQ